jgi:hypothetical protein
MGETYSIATIHVLSHSLSFVQAILSYFLIVPFYVFGILRIKETIILSLNQTFLNVWTIKA